MREKGPKIIINNKLKSIFFILFFFIFPCLAIAGYPDGFYEVGRIIDGDTFELRDGTRVKLIGIDAPEIDEYCSEHARQKLISLISGKTIYMMMTIKHMNNLSFNDFLQVCQ